MAPWHHVAICCFWTLLMTQLVKLVWHSTDTFNIAEIAECDSDPCQHDSKCVDGLDSYQCQCLGGYTGRNCETGSSCIHFNAAYVLNVGKGKTISKFLKFRPTARFNSISVKPSNRFFIAKMMSQWRKLMSMPGFFSPRTISGQRGLAIGPSRNVIMLKNVIRITKYV